MRAPHPAGHNRTLLRACWAVAVAVVVACSLLPSTSPLISTLGEIKINDKILHFAAYAILAFLPALHERRRALTAICLILIALGVALEFGQRFSFGRAFEVADMAADTAGVLIGLVSAVSMRPNSVP